LVPQPELPRGLYPLAGKPLDQLHYLLSGVEMVVRPGGRLVLPLHEIIDPLIVVTAAVTLDLPKPSRPVLFRARALEGQQDGLCTLRLTLTDVTGRPCFRYRASDVDIRLQPHGGHREREPGMVWGDPVENSMIFSELNVGQPYVFDFPDDRGGNVRSPLEPEPGGPSLKAARLPPAPDRPPADEPSEREKARPTLISVRTKGPQK
jgi:hypothetical protein